jgi:hypothetical protein
MSNTEIEVAHVCIYTISASRICTARKASVLLNGIVRIDSHLLQCFQQARKLRSYHFGSCLGLFRSLSLFPAYLTKDTPLVLCPEGVNQTSPSSDPAYTYYR